MAEPSASVQGPTQVVLVMFRPNGERRSFTVNRAVTVIGRRQECDLRIPLGEVSRKHCRLIRDHDALRVEDLGSSNGTFHNGRRVQEAHVEAGDTVQIGPLAFVVQINGDPEEETLRPVLAAGDTAVRASADPRAGGSSSGLDALNPTAQADAADADEMDFGDLPSPVEPPESRPVVRTSGRGMSGTRPSEASGEFDPMSVLDAEDSGEVTPVVEFDDDTPARDRPDESR